MLVKDESGKGVSGWRNVCGGNEMGRELWGEMEGEWGFVLDSCFHFSPEMCEGACRSMLMMPV